MDDLIERSRFSEEQFAYAFAIGRVEQIGDRCVPPDLGSEATNYTWKKKFGALAVTAPGARGLRDTGVLFSRHS